MKKILSTSILYIAMTAFVLVPILAHAAAPVTASTPTQTPIVDPADVNNLLTQGKTLTAKKTVAQAALQSILAKLSDFSNQTQLAINQLSINGIDTTQAQTALIATNNSLSKAKTDIIAFSAVAISPKISSAVTLDNLKSAANTAENSLSDAKKHLIDSLTNLKTLLPDLDTAQ